MPFFIVTDLMFPRPGDGAFARYQAHKQEIEELCRACSNFKVVFEDEVDAGSLRWRLFQSVAAPVPGLDPSDVKLILLEHVWPTVWMRDRGTFHSCIMKSLVASFPDAFIVATGRPHDIEHANNFESGRKRPVIIMDFLPHYCAMTQDMTADVGIPIQGTEQDPGGQVQRTCKDVVPKVSSCMDCFVSM